MSYSLIEAATACGVNRSTVLRAIKAGKISASKDEQGEWRIEPAELNRVYPPVQANETRPEQAHQDALIAELRSALADMRRDRDEWRAGATPRPARAQGRAGAARAGAQATADMVAVVEIDRLTPEGQPRKEEETPS